MVKCCDGSCYQGRMCPARVAHIGARYLKYPDSVPPSRWRRTARKAAGVVLFLVLGLLLGGSGLLLVVK